MGVFGVDDDLGRSRNQALLWRFCLSCSCSMAAKLMRDLVAAVQTEPSWSEEYCQNITPAFQPLQGQLAAMAASMSAGVMQELEASPGPAGLPSMTLLAGTPEAIISLMAVPGAHPAEVLKMSCAFWYMLLPWLQNWMLQKSIIEPTLLWTVRQAPSGYWVSLEVLVVKQGAWGAWVMMQFGPRFSLRRVVMLTSQSSPLESPFWKAGVSSQSISTPSRQLSTTNLASASAHQVALYPDDVGFSVAPNALTKSFTPAAAQQPFSVCWIAYFVSPNTPAPMQLRGFAQTRAASTGPPPWVQKARATQLQGSVTPLRVYPGTASPSAMAEGGHQEVKRSMYVSRTGEGRPARRGSCGLDLRSWQRLKDCVVASRHRQSTVPNIFLMKEIKWTQINSFKTRKSIHQRPPRTQGRLQIIQLHLE